MAPAPPAARQSTNVANVDVSNAGNIAWTMSKLPRVVYFDYDSYVVE